MSNSLDELVAEIDKMFPRYGIAEIYKGTDVPSGTAEKALAAFIVAMLHDLCDERSTREANARRLATAFGVASYELAQLEKQLQRASRNPESSKGHSRSA